MITTEQIPDLLNNIRATGFTEVSDAFPAELIDKVNAIVERPLNTPTINGRRGYVQSGNARFLYQTLSWGREVLDLYAYPPLIELVDRYAGDVVHLSNYRIYRTFPSDVCKMQWHVDNKVDTYDYDNDCFVTQVVEQDMGIILILYLSDVEDGGFQIVAKSHEWAYTHETWDDKESDFADQVVTFNNRKKNTAIIYDYRCIHRAKPYTGGSIRTSLFGQYSPSRMPAGEPVILCARDLAGLTQTQQRVLNFGKNPTTENWPIGAPAEIIDALGLKLARERSFPARVKSRLRRMAHWGFVGLGD